MRVAGADLAAAGGFGLATLVLAAGIGGLGLVMLIGLGRGIRANALPAGVRATEAFL